MTRLRPLWPLAGNPEQHHRSGDREHADALLGLIAVIGTMALPPGFARAVDKAVAARLRALGMARTLSVEALAERERRLTDAYVAGRMSKTDYDRDWQAIQEQRTVTRSVPRSKPVSP